jgi:hypothetical protein
MRKLAVILLVAASAPALAEPTRDEVMSGAERCYGIADNHAWLDCFYGSAQPMRTLLGLAPAPPAQVKLVPPPGADYGGARAPRTLRENKPPQETRGFISDLLGSGKPLVADVPMAAYDLGPAGFTVTLPDGQRWAQDDGSSAAHWRGPASAYRVTVTTGALSSFKLRVKGEDRTYKVHKVH